MKRILAVTVLASFLAVGAPASAKNVVHHRPVYPSWLQQILNKHPHGHLTIRQGHLVPFGTYLSGQDQQNCGTFYIYAYANYTAGPGVEVYAGWNVTVDQAIYDGGDPYGFLWNEVVIDWSNYNYRGYEDGSNNYTNWYWYNDIIFPLGPGSYEAIVETDYPADTWIWVPYGYCISNGPVDFADA